MWNLEAIDKSKKMHRSRLSEDFGGQLADLSNSVMKYKGSKFVDSASLVEDDVIIN